MVFADYEAVQALMGALHCAAQFLQLVREIGHAAGESLYAPGWHFGRRSFDFGRDRFRRARYVYALRQALWFCIERFDALLVGCRGVGCRFAAVRRRSQALKEFVPRPF